MDSAALAELDSTITDVRETLKNKQGKDGHWVFELEADATIPAEYIMLEHYLDMIDAPVQQKLAVYLREIQGEHGGWPLYHAGDLNVSASVKAYYALKLAGDSPDAPHMVKARNAILAHGGAGAVNVFTRIALALFGQLPWSAVPTMPVEIMHLPRWFPFHLDKVSYWSRTVIVPLLILMSLRPRARNRSGIGIAELFLASPADQPPPLPNPQNSGWGTFFLGLDKVLKVVEPGFPKAVRQRAVDKALAFIKERLNGEDGLGAIFPAMANTVMAYDALGYAKDHPDRAIAWASIRKLLVLEEHRGYCQPCLSPIWDTSLMTHALLEAGEPADSPAIKGSLDWLVKRQVTDVVGDWAVRRPGLRPGGWAFQYNNPHYPDVDDTAVVAMVLDRAGHADHKESIARAEEWVIGMQSANGGWGAFDAENDKHYLNHIPFSDHGALLDPPTADVSARCLSMLAQLGRKAGDPVVDRAVAYLRKEQEPDGSWFGRWGTNYVYGTWSVLCALNAIDIDAQDPMVRKAVQYLVGKQNRDGGWGEDGETYWTDKKHVAKASTPSQTAWALMGLMAAGETEHPATERGVKWLMQHPRKEGRWTEDLFTAVGFPRVFYLRYHGYAQYFPLWALARYRNLKTGNSQRVLHGM
ncbi:squalene--hopene cyclase [Zavarzinia sp. CC-PAN008]|uniref:squalene--hopene cyclase n=1 Tax=Zavarzinia sp. CC-PAN008 TaxID=3243332 RepID=UPI003F7454CF